MATEYDLIIVGMGSAGLVAAEFAATLDLKIAAVEQDRVGGDCLWTGCVPSKALLASAKVAHHMRTADEYGIAGVEPQVDGAKVWDRIHSIQQEIADTDDSPERYREMGVSSTSGTPGLPDRTPCRSATARSCRGASSCSAPGAGRSCRRSTAS